MYFKIPSLTDSTASSSSEMIFFAADNTAFEERNFHSVQQF
jgi:hypothetical protein